MDYQVIIVGASFAGLSVASQLNAKVLLIDRQPIGAGQTSACATYLKVLERLNCLESLQQIHSEIVIHTSRKKPISFSLPDPFCTFNYLKFCRMLYEQLKVDFLKARVLGWRENKIITSKGSFSADCFVDASGWRAVLATGVMSKFSQPSFASFGVESSANYKDEGLHFFSGRRVIKRGFGWVFPTGESGSNIGLASYVTNEGVTVSFKKFFRLYSNEVNNLHGGYFTSKLRQPTCNQIFLVGDAAGHCLPATGEGIRTAIYFGEKCGQIIQQIIEGRLTLAAGLKEYQDFVFLHRNGYQKLRRFQQIFSLLPNWFFHQVAVYTSQPRIWQSAIEKYTNLANPYQLKGPIKS